MPEDKTRNEDAGNRGAPDLPDDALANFPYYEEGKVPQYHKYHAEVSYLDEIELIWGKKWGAQGIGRLREVAMVKPTETEVKKLYEQASSFFVFNGITPDLDLMQAQHYALAETYRGLGIEVHYIGWAEDPPRSAYGPLKRSISAAAGFVINGGAIIPREATPYWRGRSRYVSKFLMSIDCPILYTVHGKGVCEIGAATRMSDDFIVSCCRPTQTAKASNRSFRSCTMRDTGKSTWRTAPALSTTFMKTCPVGCTPICGSRPSTSGGR